MGWSCVVGEAKNPAQAKLRDWPMFQGGAGKGRKRKAAVLDGRPHPRISELLVSQLTGTAEDKLAWLAEQKAAGKLDGDDPAEIAEAEALLDEGLKASFPASDPVSVGHFTGTEAV